jgi:outer membrane biosynthesis protein TonB
VIPEAKIQWRDVALAAVTTSIAFTIVNYILGTYIQTFTITTIIGAAGALMILLIWIFSLNQIILFGAEVSKVHTINYGTQSNKNMPETAKKIVEPIEKAGEKVEAVTKGAEVEKPRKKEEGQTVETTNSMQAPMKKENHLISNVAQAKEPLPEQESSSVEVSVKIKAQKKKTKKGE